MKNFFSIALISAAAYAQSVAHISNASIEATAAALNSNCCGADNLACACTENQEVFRKERQCTQVQKFRENKKLVMEEVMEKQTREIQKTVMVPYTVQVKQIKTVQKPVKKIVQRQRVDHRLSTNVSWKEVSEQVKVPVPKPECSCYSPSCGCVGQPGCGCCQPECGCAPPRVQYALQTVSKMVPVGERVRTPVMVPYQEEITVMQDEHILHMQPVTEMRPKIVKETIEEIVPVYKEVEVVTKEPYTVEECKDVLVSEGDRAVVQQLTFETVHQTHEDGEDTHKHAKFSRSGPVDSPANPDMHSHVVHTNGLAFHVAGDEAEAATEDVAGDE